MIAGLKGARMIRKVEMERYTVTSSKPFDAVVAAIKASIGHPNMAELWQATQRATTAAELEAAIQPVLGESRSDAICRVRSRNDCSQGDRASRIQNHPSGHWK